MIVSADGHSGVAGHLCLYAEYNTVLHHATELHPSVFTRLHFISNSLLKENG